MKLDDEEKQIIAEYEKGNIKARKPTKNELNEKRSRLINWYKVYRNGCWTDVLETGNLY